MKKSGVYPTTAKHYYTPAIRISIYLSHNLPDARIDVLSWPSAFVASWVTAGSGFAANNAFASSPIPSCWLLKPTHQNDAIIGINHPLLFRVIMQSRLTSKLEHFRKIANSSSIFLSRSEECGCIEIPDTQQKYQGSLTESLKLLL